MVVAARSQAAGSASERSAYGLGDDRPEIVGGEELRYASVVSTKPGGTGSPSAAILDQRCAFAAGLIQVGAGPACRVLVRVQTPARAGVASMSA